MSVVMRIRAWPRLAATGAAVAVYLAGGNNDAPHYDGQHYMAGVIADPRFEASVSFTDDGWAARAVPQVGAIGWLPAEPERLDPLTAYYWRDAAIEIDRIKDGVTTRRLTGTIAEATIKEGRLEITCADLSNRLDKPFITATFAGSGGIEGGDFAIGRVKRRSFGRVWNVEGRLLDKANNIYEFGDPAFPLQGCTALRDKGRTGLLDILGWQGSVAATFAALQASNPVQGGGIFAPSIACAKWWTQPSGPLTADLQGEAAGYAETPARIAAQLLAAVGGPAISNLVAASALRPGQSGIHIGDNSETTASALDRLFQRVTLIWVLTPAGDIDVRPWTFAAPVEALNAIFISRERTVRPVKTRRVGYLKNERQHGDGEISIAVSSDDVLFPDGTPATQALAELNALLGDIEATVDAKRNTFVRQTAPSAAESEENDWWVRLDASGVAIETYRRVAGSGRLSIGGNAIVLGGSYIELCWAPVADQRITNALAAATAASNLADSKAVVFTMFAASDPVPAGTDFGDVLVRAYLNPVQMDYWNGSAWVAAATYGATAAQINLIGQALTDAANAQATADGKIDTYYQTSAPAGATIGDLWFDTDDGNKLYRHNGSGWVAAQDSGIGQAITLAAGAQATADGKVTTYVGEAAPGGPALGDLWFKASTNILSRWSGAAWAAVSSVGAPTGTNVGGTDAGTVANGANAANNGLNADGSVKGDKVTTSSIAAGSVFSTTTTSASGSSTPFSTIHELSYVTVGSLPSGVTGIKIAAYGQIRYVGMPTPGYPVLRIYRVPAANAAAYLASAGGSGRNPSSHGTVIGKNVTLLNVSNIDMGATILHSSASPNAGDLYVLAVDVVAYPPAAGAWSYNWSGEVSIDIVKR